MTGTEWAALAQSMTEENAVLVISELITRVAGARSAPDRLPTIIFGALSGAVSTLVARRDLEALIDKLDVLDASLSNLRLPFAYRQSAYDARLHVDLVRRDINRRQS